MRSKKLLNFILVILITILVLANSQEVLAQESNYTCAVYITGVGCPHCARADPFILRDLLKEYPDLVIIEYEIYQQRENAPLIEEYNKNYNSGLGIPLIIFNKEEHIIGDTPILDNARGAVEKLRGNPCPLIDGTSQKFEELNLADLPGQPKIWGEDRVLIKTNEENKWIFEWNGETIEKQSSIETNLNNVLQELFKTENIANITKEVDYSSIKSLPVPLSGKSVSFDNAIEIKTESESISAKKELTLPKILSLAVVDAVNPCALAVLSLMLITILTYNPAKRINILLAGSAFALSVFVMYLIYGLIIIRSFQLIQVLTAARLWLYKILGTGAIILGCFKIKDFFQSKAVCKTVPKVNKIISKVTSPKGAFLIGAFVTIFLLPCTIGPYVIAGGILSALKILETLPWLFLYNLVFVLPMAAVILIVYFSMAKIKDISSWEVKNRKYMDLVAGIIMGGLGVAMVLGLV